MIRVTDSASPLKENYGTTRHLTELFLPRGFPLARAHQFQSLLVYVTSDLYDVSGTILSVSRVSKSRSPDWSDCMVTIGEALKAKAKEASPVVSELSIFLQLIKERKHPLDLVRELLSNSGAQEVGATRIEISYTRDREGHVFEISDNGCGMFYTGDAAMPGRLDKISWPGLVGHRGNLL